MTNTEALMQINTLLSQLTADELISVAISAQQRAKGKTWNEINVGDNVIFDAKTRGVKRGVVIKKNAKTYQVLVGSSTWKVSPVLLRKVA